MTWGVVTRALPTSLARLQKPTHLRARLIDVREPMPQLTRDSSGPEGIEHPKPSTLA